MTLPHESLEAQGRLVPLGYVPESVRIVAGADFIAAATPEAAGSARDLAVLPTHPVRVRPQIDSWPRGEFDIVGAPIAGLDPQHALARFSQGLTEHALVAWVDDHTLGVALSPDSPAWESREFHEFLGVAARSRDSRPSTLGVGLLGYGAIGAEHARAVQGTPGLELAAVCDPNPERVRAAQAIAPGLTAAASPQELFTDPRVDVVIVSTPPDSHAGWAIQALNAGCHVVVEKPMALTARECDEILEAARERGLSASVYQNRRFDPDYRLIKEAVVSGAIGDPFHVEAFVGGYSHPCNYWHSDAEVSGGALFDWGSHIVDQLLDLMPGSVESVSAINHKRVWHDVTNADHARMTILFDGGREATFIFSDLAAAMKPRWYVLGTAGALTGEWREESVIARSAVGTLDEDVLAPADSPPRVQLHSPQGDVTVLAARPREPFPFHADLVLALSYGFPARVRGEQSRQVVALLEAAEDSARLGGMPVKPS